MAGAIVACLAWSAAAETAGERRPVTPPPSLEEDNRSGRLDDAVTTANVEGGPVATSAGGDRLVRAPKPVARVKPRQPEAPRKASVVEQIRRAAFSTEKGR